MTDAFRYLNSPSAYGSPDEFAPECEWCEGRGVTCAPGVSNLQCWTAPLPVTGVRMRSAWCYENHKCEACDGSGIVTEVKK